MSEMNILATVDAILAGKEQGSLYAAHIGETPLARFLHRARKGELTLESLRNTFQKPAAAIAFARRVGLWAEGNNAGSKT